MLVVLVLAAPLAAQPREADPAGGALPWELAPDDPHRVDDRTLLAPRGGADAALVALHQRAKAHRAAGRPAQAGMIWELMAAQAPHAGPWLHLQAARSFAEAGAAEPARRHLAQASGLPSTFETELALAEAWTLRAEGAPGPALAQVLAALPSFDAAAPAVCELGALLLEELLRAGRPALPDPAEPAFAGLHALPAACHGQEAEASLEVSFKKLKRYLKSGPARALLPDVEDRLRAARIDYREVRNKAAERAMDGLLKAPRLSDAALCEAHFMRAVLLRRTRRGALAGAEFAAAAEPCAQLQTDNPTLQDMRAQMILAGLGRWTPAKARELIGSVLRDTPRHRVADDLLAHLARLAEREGDAAQAQALRDRLLSEYGDQDAVREPLWTSAWTELRAGRWDRALPALEQGDALPPDATYYSQGRFTWFRAGALLRSGREAEAVEVLERCARDNPSSFYGHLCAQGLLARGRALTPMPAEALPVSFSLPAGLPRGLAWLGEPGAASAALLSGVASPSSHDLWLAALLSDAGGDFTRSHNIARRRVSGFPQGYGSPTPATRRLWEVAYPAPWPELVRPNATSRGVPPALMWAIMREESGFDPAIVSYAGAVGLMQLMLPTARGNARDVEGPVNPDTLTQPAINLPIAATLLARLLKMFDRHPLLTAAAYNAGPRPPLKWAASRRGMDLGLFAESMDYTQARNYSRRVVGSYFIYQRLYTGDAPLHTWPLQVP